MGAPLWLRENTTCLLSTYGAALDKGVYAIITGFTTTNLNEGAHYDERRNGRLALGLRLWPLDIRTIVLGGGDPRCCRRGQISHQK